MIKTFCDFCGEELGIVGSAEMNITENLGSYGKVSKKLDICANCLDKLEKSRVIYECKTNAPNVFEEKEVSDH